MFIPLNVKNNIQDEALPNILVAGDTAGIFFMLRPLSGSENNIFLADTGVKRNSVLSFHNARDYRNTGKSNVYYDFFGDIGAIGAGIIRRMDMVIFMAMDDVSSDWCRFFHVPCVHVKYYANVIQLRFEGIVPRDMDRYECGEEEAIADLLLSCLRKYGYKYEPGSVTEVEIEPMGVVSMHTGQSENIIRKEPLVPIETNFSAWDDINDILAEGEAISLEIQGHNAIEHSEEGLKLVEIGVPELHIIKVTGKDASRYIELTGDLMRVFDGIF